MVLELEHRFRMGSQGTLYEEEVGQLDFQWYCHTPIVCIVPISLNNDTRRRGVGASLGGEEQLSYTLTAKSVNHRFLDLQFRLPSGLDAVEMDLRRVLKENLIRGHVDLTLSVDRSAQAKAGYNRELIAGYLTAFDAARKEHGLNGEPDLNAALRLPGAFGNPKIATTPT